MAYSNYSPNFQENLYASVAFGTAVVGYDLLVNVPENRVSFARTISAIACTGGTAAGDCGFELWVDGQKKGTYFNTAAGAAADKQRDLKDADTYVPANALIQCKVIDAAPANTMTVSMEFKKPSSGGTWKRKTYRRSSSRSTRRY